LATHDIKSTNPAGPNLITSWQQCRLKAPPYLFPDDHILRKPEARSYIAKHRTFEKFIASRDFDPARGHKLQLGLLPVPYVGNLQQASVFILMLNPGFDLGDYFAEQVSPALHATLIRNLHQTNDSDQFPFWCLDPQFAWTGGFQYWRPRLDPIITRLAEQKHLSYPKALEHVAQAVACIELIPYHSMSFKLRAQFSRQLASRSKVIEYVADVLVPRARNGEVVIVAARGGATWNLPQHENIVVYEKSETRSAHLSLKSWGGKLIARQLGV